MNCYTHMGTIKDSGTLGLTSTGFDTQLLRIAQESSRMIDKYCDRFFYIYEGIRYYDGAGFRVILDDDVYSVTTLEVDTDGDGVYESSFNLTTTSPDAFLYPLNGTPKTRLEANPWGDYGHFGAGIRRAIKITGEFGYGADWPASYTIANANTLTTAVNTTATALVVVGISTDYQFYPGQTLLITNSAATPLHEQVYITTKTASTDYTIVRGRNGTSGIVSGTTATIAVCDYPQAIIQACVIQTIRTWKRRESGYVNTIINTDMGNVQVFKGLDPDVKEIINQYRRIRSAPRYI